MRSTLDSKTMEKTIEELRELNDAALASHPEELELELLLDLRSEVEAHEGEAFNELWYDEGMTFVHDRYVEDYVRAKCLKTHGDSINRWPFSRIDWKEATADYIKHAPSYKVGDDLYWEV